MFRNCTYITVPRYQNLKKNLLHMLVSLGWLMMISEKIKEPNDSSAYG